MSGHSHWSTIKRQKQAEDQKRGRLFARISRGITIAAREVGGNTDPQTNPKLRVAIKEAQEANMPKERITQAINRAAGGGESGERVVFGAFAQPGNIALLIETVTDNRNRTIAKIRNILESGGGTLAAKEAVEPHFKYKSDVQATPKLSNLLSNLRECEDVENVSTNADIADS